jgi:ATP-dependent helicase/nuclease subunit A
MGTPDTPPADQAVRDAVVAESTRSVSVDASAGTGKTTLMTARVIRLATELRSLLPVAVLTFGEAAAAELRRRIRRAVMSLGDRDLSRRLLVQLPGASITTIHAFASSMLREYTHLTGIDPSFDTLEQAFPPPRLARLWEEHLEEPGELAAECGDLSYSVADLPGAALRLAASPLPLEPATLLDGRPDVRTLLLERIAELRLLASGGPPGDTLTQRLPGFLDAASDWTVRFPAGGAPPGVDLRAGSPKAWGGALPTVRQAAGSLRDLLASAELLERYSGIVLPFASRLRRARLEDRASLSFDEMLSRFAGALESSPGLRGALERRFAHVLVDEYQDTSADQARIFRLMLGGPGGYRRGSITIVGDPKQSIYGWRQADLEAYREERSAFSEPDAMSAEISVCFRATRSVIAFVNALGPALFDGSSPFDCGYSEFSPAPGAAQGSPPLLALVGDKGDDGRVLPAEVVRARAAAWIASHLAGRHDGGDAWDRWAVLLRGGQAAGALLSALHDRGIPFSATVGRDFKSRPETGDLRRMLALLLDPGDRLSLFHVLRSPFFGIDDRSLTEAALAGLDSFLRPPAGAPDCITEACGALASLRRSASSMPPAEFLRFLLDRTPLTRVVAASGYEAERRLGNLRYVLERCMRGSFANLAALRDSLADLGGERLEEPSTVSMKDRVTVTTIHKAKGLTFDNVIVLPPLTDRAGPVREDLLLDGRRGRAGVRLGGARSPSWEDLKVIEAEKRLAEERRLLYVALTRSAGELVMVHPERIWLSGGSGAKSMDALLSHAIRSIGDDGLYRVVGPVAPPEARPRAPAHAGPVRDGDRVEPPVVELDIPDPAGRAAADLGTAVHMLLEKIDFADPGGWLSRSLPAARLPRGVDAERASRLALSFFSLGLPFDPAACAIVGREYPYLSRNAAGAMEARYVDLLADDGSRLHAVDYKTDDVTAGEVPARAAIYAPRQREYGGDLASALGRPVSVWLAFLAPGVLFHVSDHSP